jgi:ankyrin repeat protein
MKSQYILFLTLLVTSTSFMQLSAAQYMITGINDYGVDADTPLLRAIQANDLAGVGYLIAHDADVNLESDDGTDTTPLMAASIAGNSNIIRLLLQHGASIDKQDSEGDTALMLAVEQDDIDSVNILLNNGADKNITNSHQETAYDIAIDLDLTDIVTTFDTWKRRR